MALRVLTNVRAILVISIALGVGMWSELSKFSLEFLRLAPRYFFAVMIVCAFLLLMPLHVQQALGTTNFVSINRQWIGLALLASTAVWLVAIASLAISWIKRVCRSRRRIKHVIRRLESLTEPEKQVLRFYIARNTRGNKLRLENGDVQALSGAGIIFRSASVGSVLEGFAQNITDFAWDYIHANPHVLEGSTNTYHTDERNDGYR